MLSPDVQAFLDTLLPLDKETHFLNYSRGLLANDGKCGIDRDLPVYALRIPSTWCEQKRWNDILVTLPPDLWLSMAYGQPAVVHDRSEKARATRAVWQGLSWVRYATNAAWDLPVAAEVSRSGMNVNSYWAEQFHALPKSTRNLLKYWLNFYRGDGSSVNLRGCDTCDKGSANG